MDMHGSRLPRAAAERTVPEQTEDRQKDTIMPTTRNAARKHRSMYKSFEFLIPHDIYDGVALALAASSPRALARLCLASKAWHAAVAGAVVGTSAGRSALAVGMSSELSEYDFRQYSTDGTFFKRFDPSCHHLCLPRPTSLASAARATGLPPRSTLELVAALATLSTPPSMAKMYVELASNDAMGDFVSGEGAVDIGRALGRARSSAQWTPSLVADVYLADKAAPQLWTADLETISNLAIDLVDLVVGLGDDGAAQRGFSVDHEEVVSLLLAPTTPGPMVTSASRAFFLVHPLPTELRHTPPPMLADADAATASTALLRP